MKLYTHYPIGKKNQRESTRRSPRGAYERGFLTCSDRRGSTATACVICSSGRVAIIPFHLRKSSFPIFPRRPAFLPSFLLALSPPSHGTGLFSNSSKPRTWTEVTAKRKNLRPPSNPVRSLPLQSNPRGSSSSHTTSRPLPATSPRAGYRALTMDVPVDPVMAYKYKAELLVKDYLLADSYVPYAAVLVGILMCKLAYDFTRFISSFHYKGYASLTKMQKVEWNNRGMSTVHAIFITVMSVYLVFFSGLFSDNLDGPVTSRSSSLSSFTLGVSIGYFITDIAMIYWFYPSLGGMEYVVHHMLSLMSTVYAMLSGEAHVYIYMGLITETTTPGINLRWFLDAAGMKNSKAYLVNGAAMVVTWLVARIILFMYLFYHMFVHYDQIKQMDTFGYFLVLIAPSIIFVMNLLWFSKILRGLKKTMAKRH